MQPASLANIFWAAASLQLAAAAEPLLQQLLLLLEVQVKMPGFDSLTMHDQSSWPGRLACLQVHQAAALCGLAVQQSNLHMMD
jgi:hypothetical protein